MEVSTIAKKATFINLSNKVFAKYFFEYRINDLYSINELTRFRDKHQLLFQKLVNINQQVNLAIVDSVFANILADVLLEVFLNKISTFNQYISTKNKISFVGRKDELVYFKYKFFNFIHFLLYSEIALNKAFKGEISSDRVYCLKNTAGEIEYYSFYDQAELQLKLLDDLQLEIDLDSSNISNKTVKLCLRISHK
ncbi:MAG TPA: HpaII family restriction endonuclease [Chitinophagales bacterium]|nr:HpaII family restriction endonuclease [Chitinophagales bacterium]